MKSPERFDITMSNIANFTLESKIGRLAALSLVALGFLGIPKSSKAADISGYPWYPDAVHVAMPPAKDMITWGYTDKATCDNKSAEFDCSSKTTDDGQYYFRDQWGYDLRNCTSYVAWRVAKEFGKDISGWGDADKWETGAANAGYTVDSTPETGDIAQWNSTHVAFVEEVFPQEGGGYKVRVSEFNQRLDGNPRTDRIVQANNYIDINGTGVVWNGGGSSSGGNTAPSPGGTELTPHDKVGETDIVMSQESHVYRKVGGVFWYIKHKNNWTAEDTKTWGKEPTATVATSEIHDYEVGYPNPGDHPPGHGTAVYRQGEQQQYYFYSQNAYPITGGELDDLNVRNKAQMIPNTMRLWDFTGKPLPMEDDMIYRVAGDPTVRVADLRSYGWLGLHANNNAVLDCIKFTSGRSTINIIPQSARRTVEIHDSSIPVLCAFPPQIVVKTPEDPKQFRVTGDNSNEGYLLHQYPTPLLTYLHTNGSPDIRTTTAIYGLKQAEPMTPPEGAFFRNMSNNEVFRSAGGIYQKAPSPDILVCHGNPSNIINVPGNAMEGMPQGPLLACAYTNRIIYGPDGQQYYITALNQREPIGNTAISACIKVRRGAGEPVPVAASTIGNDYPPDGKDAWCPYELQPGLNFVKERSRNEVYKVSSDGSLQHAAALCPNPNNLYKLNWHEVPDNETASNVRGLTWYPSPEVCAALPG